jgi:excisionase family DNA binding protein
MELLTVKQAAKELGLSPGRVRQFCQQGRIGTLYGWQWLISREELDKFKEIERPAGRPPKQSP